jgi:hypothetical protein
MIIEGLAEVHIFVVNFHRPFLNALMLVIYASSLRFDDHVQ